MSNRLVFSLCILVCLPAFLAAQIPQIFYRGVVNAAHGLPAGLPAGSIARGSVFSIFGTNLGPANSPGLAFPLSTNLGGVSIKVTGASSADVIPLYVSPTQINAIMPSTAPLGAASLVVTFNGTPGSATPVRIVNSSFGIFTANQTGYGPGIAQNFNSQGDQPINAPTISAKPGQAITLWGTGLGPVPYADNIQPTVGNLPVQVEVFVGGVLASPLLYSGRSFGFSGVDQIVFFVPSNAPLGCWVPVQVRTAGSNVSNVVTMAISADGSPCSDPSNPYAKEILAGGKLGFIGLNRTVSLYTVNTPPPVNITVDLAAAAFREISAGAFPFDAATSLPPPGSCTVIGGNANFVSRPFRNPFIKRSLNTGPLLTITGPRGAQTVGLPLATTAQLGKNIPGTNLTNSVFLEPGNINFSAGSGGDVGAFQGALTNPAALTWTNRDQITVINRSQPLTVTWSGAPSGQPVEIVGASVDLPTHSSAKFICVAPSGSTSFTVPAPILQSLPATRTAGAQFKGTLSVGAIGATVPFTASGLDFGVASVSSFSGKPVSYQ